MESINFEVSLEAQAEKIRSTAAAQGLEINQIIVDAGESARNLYRPRMVKLLQLVPQHDIPGTFHGSRPSGVTSHQGDQATPAVG